MKFQNLFINFLKKNSIVIRWYRYIRKHNPVYEEYKMSKILRMIDPYDYMCLIKWKQTKEGEAFWAKKNEQWRIKYKRNK